jgi:hypothetical protein
MLLSTGHVTSSVTPLTRWGWGGDLSVTHSRALKKRTNERPCLQRLWTDDGREFAFHISRGWGKNWPLSLPFANPTRPGMFWYYVFYFFILFIYLFSFIYFLTVLVAEHWASNLLASHSATWTMPPTPFCFSYFSDKVLHFAQTGLDHHLPTGIAPPGLLDEM